MLLNRYKNKGGGNIQIKINEKYQIFYIFLEFLNK